MDRSSLLVVGTGMIVLWHADSLDPLERIGPYMGAIHELAFDSTGQWLIVALPRLVKLWSLQSRTEHNVGLAMSSGHRF